MIVASPGLHQSGPHVAGLFPNAAVMPPPR